MITYTAWCLPNTGEHQVGSVGTHLHGWTSATEGDAHPSDLMLPQCRWVSTSMDEQPPMKVYAHTFNLMPAQYGWILCWIGGHQHMERGAPSIDMMASQSGRASSRTGENSLPWVVIHSWKWMLLPSTYVTMAYVCHPIATDRFG